MVVDDECKEDTEGEGGTSEVDDDGECGSGCDISCGGDAVSPVEQ